MNYDNNYDTTDYNISDMFFNEPTVYKQPPVPQNIPVLPKTEKFDTTIKQDTEKLFLYFIIIILISSIVIMVRDYNNQFMELTRKVVKVI